MASNFFVSSRRPPFFSPISTRMSLLLGLRKNLGTTAAFVFCLFSSCAAIAGSFTVKEFHNNSSKVFQPCTNASLWAGTLVVGEEPRERRLNVLLYNIRSDSWHPPFATFVTILVNVAIYASGIKSGDSRWTILGKRWAVLRKAFTIKDLALNLFVPLWLRRNQPLALKSRKQYVRELPLYFASNWIHADMEHLQSNMVALLEFGSVLEQMKGARFVVLSTLLGGSLLESVLRAAFLFFNGVEPLHGFFKTQSARKQIHNHFRFGAGFSGVCCHLATLVAFESSVARPWRVYALLRLCNDAFTITSGGKMKEHLEVHWGHLIGMVSGLLQAGYTPIQNRLKKKASSTCTTAGETSSAMKPPQHKHFAWLSVVRSFMSRCIKAVQTSK